MLEGIKVLSFTHFLQGPAAVQMLADVGADVIKIEPPGGAFERSWTGADAFIEGVSVFFLLGNRNQRSISLDLREEAAREIVWRLIREADVIVENYRPGVLDKMGFGYAQVHEVNPRLVYCSCTGYGSSGPYLKRPGQDLLLQAMSGMTLLSGDAESPPTPVGSAIVDQHAAALAAFGVVAALQARERTGVGARIESNLLNAALDLQIEPFTYYMNKGPLWARTHPPTGSRFHPAPYGVYKTRDGYIAMSLTPTQKLAGALSCPALAEFTHPKGARASCSFVRSRFSPRCQCDAAFDIGVDLLRCITQFREHFAGMLSLFRRMATQTRRFAVIAHRMREQAHGAGFVMVEAF